MYSISLVINRCLPDTLMHFPQMFIALSWCFELCLARPAPTVAAARAGESIGSAKFERRYSAMRATLDARTEFWAGILWYMPISTLAAKRQITVLAFDSLS